MFKILKKCSTETRLYLNENILKEVKEKLNPFAQKTFGNNIVTEIKSISTFYRAEEYHQKYFEKNY